MARVRSSAREFLDAMSGAKRKKKKSVLSDGGRKGKSGRGTSAALAEEASSRELAAVVLTA